MVCTYHNVAVGIGIHTLIVFNIDYKNATSVQCIKASVIVFDKIEIVILLPTLIMLMSLPHS